MENVAIPPNLVVMAIKRDCETTDNPDLTAALDFLYEHHRFAEMTILQTESIGLIGDNVNPMLNGFLIQHAVKKLAQKAIKQEIARKVQSECELAGLTKPYKELVRSVTDSVMQHHLANAPIEYNIYHCRFNVNPYESTHLHIPAPHNVAMKILAFLRKAPTFYATDLKTNKPIDDVLKEWVVNESDLLDGKCKMLLNNEEVMTLQNSDLELAAKQCRAIEGLNHQVLSLQIKLNDLQFSIDASKTGLVLTGIKPVSKKTDDGIQDEYANFYLLCDLVADLLDKFGGENGYAW